MLVKFFCKIEAAKTIPAVTDDIDFTLASVRPIALEKQSEASPTKSEKLVLNYCSIGWNARNHFSKPVRQNEITSHSLCDSAELH